MSENPLPDLALSGIEKFNRGAFYECHEDLEDAWRAEPRRVRFLYQGILQIGVGLYHQRNGNYKGAVGLLTRGVERLKDFEPVSCEIDVRKLVRESEGCLKELKRLGRERVGEFDASLAPKVEFVRE